jgi:thioredoxin-related protein
MKILSILPIVVVASCLLSPTVRAQSEIPRPSVVGAAKFDPTRNAAQDIKAGIAEAKRTKRHVLLDVGGEWCIWCHRLDAFFSDNKDVNELLKKHYVVVKVNFSKENKNERVLSKYPKIKGYPHLFVLDKRGRLLHSQNTGDLESGKGYDKSKVVALLKAWAPKLRNE